MLYTVQVIRMGTPYTTNIGKYIDKLYTDILSKLRLRLNFALSEESRCSDIIIISYLGDIINFLDMILT